MFSSGNDTVQRVEHLVLGGGPVGASAAWYLAENGSCEDGSRTVLVHDPTNKGAHEDWSRLARLSFDGMADEFALSQHAVSLLELVEEVRSMQSGAPVIPLKPGMLWVASPGTPMAQALTHGETLGDSLMKRVAASELESIFPGNAFNLPAETLCWTHPAGLCVSPLELASASRGTAQAYGVEILTSRAHVDMADDKDLVRVTLDSGEVFDTPRLYLFAGAQSKQLLSTSVQREPVRNRDLHIPELDETYITAVSTVRYSHVNHPSDPAPGSGHVPPPITLGQLEVPELLGHQANFSIVAEEMGDVLKCRLSGAAGAEIIETVAGMHELAAKGVDTEMAATYKRVFGALFPFLHTEKALDFNRCVTYRNRNPHFSGTSLLTKSVGDTGSSKIMVSPGCYGVGVKFGPALGEAAAAHSLGNEVHEGMNVFTSADPKLQEETKKPEWASSHLWAGGSSAGPVTDLG